ncbi:hypothetical protein GUJ93_ZPchr0014g47287 [Zizania palustris]|uniref:C2H2-type domain-containing protein n=1 Tax=Zizania palustris TaxID=103762 RepID=A0A8J5SYC2_ZIZPA|nr:hypothetical protein GUJ93_ZPchr0014g47287 [Zizania palustris]
MRAHGVIDDGDGSGVAADKDGDDDDDGIGDVAVRRARVQRDDLRNSGGASSSGTVYALRANRPTRRHWVCKNCGVEFPSWEDFVRHGKCNSSEDDGDEEETDRSLQLWSLPSVADGQDGPMSAPARSKGKRSSREWRRTTSMGGSSDLSPSMSRSAYEAGEEEDVANLLVMLSSSKESSLSVDKQDRTLQPISFTQRPVSSNLGNTVHTMAPPPSSQFASTMPHGMFECKGCKKVFSSHQALGGHRASHNTVKGCFASKYEHNEFRIAAAFGSPDVGINVDASTEGGANAGTNAAVATTPIEPLVPALAAAPFRKKSKLHECSVCHRVFTTGQALGGHKRCHWLTSSSVDHTSSVANLTPLADDLVGAACKRLSFRPMLDASEPALELSIGANPPPLATATTGRAEVGGSSFHPHAPSPVYIQSAAIPRRGSHRNEPATTTPGSQKANDVEGFNTEAGDEADSTTVKIARFSDLKDVSLAGETTSWLQVGIASSSPRSRDDDEE